MKKTGVPTANLRPILLTPLGYQLKQLRIKAELTQSELAQLTNRTESTISRYEQGHTDLSVGTLWCLASAMGYDLEINFWPEKR